MAHPLVAVVGGAVDGAAPGPARVCHSAGEGWGSQTWTSRSAASASSSSISVTDSRVWPNRDSRTGRSNASGSSRSRATRGARAARAGDGASTAVDQAPPQLGLPGQVGGEGAPGAVGVAARGPVGDQRRPLTGVRREQAARAGGPPRSGAPAGGRPRHRCARGRGGGRAWRPRARRGCASMHVEQRPGERVRGPRVVVAGAGDLGDQRAGRPERDGRAHAVAVGSGAEHVGEPLGEPPLHPARGHDDQLGRERVGQRGRPGACPARRPARRRAGHGAGGGSRAEPMRGRRQAGGPRHAAAPAPEARGGG